MIQRVIIIVSILSVLASAVPCDAVIVFQKGRDEPIRGYLVEESANRIVVNEVLPSGELRKWDLARVQIDDVVRAVSVEKLVKLSSDKPEGYRQYAEDLAAKTEDPDARAVAIRLYLIAAYLAPDELGRSCLLGAAALARTPEEERAFHAMAFVLDPDHDATLLKRPKAVATNSDSIADEDRDKLRTAVQMLRRGKLSEAREYFGLRSVQRAQAFYGHIATQDDYLAAIEAEGRLSPRLLHKFVTLEVTLSGIASTNAREKSSQAVPWSQTIARKRTRPIKPLAIEALTEFDPRACHFVDGKWVKP